MNLTDRIRFRILLMRYLHSDSKSSPQKIMAGIWKSGDDKDYTDLMLSLISEELDMMAKLNMIRCETIFGVSDYFYSVYYDNRPCKINAGIPNSKNVVLSQDDIFHGDIDEFINLFEVECDG